MANPPSHSRVLQPKPKYSNLLIRFIAIFILTLVVLVGIVVIIIWLVVKPKHLDYSVENAAVQNFNLTDANHLYANFDFTIRSYNPNSIVSIYYDKVEIYVSYEDQTLAINAIQPFFQSHKNVTRLQVRVTAQTVALYGSVPKDLRVEKSSGDIELDLFMRAKIRFKVGRWKSKRRSMSVFCSPVLVNFSRDKSFYRTSCEVEI
ncbi:PREDICTED: uncharacterized protein At1g08160-like [Lupinus angustifolius]|uniref:uncharacterized protein At1g08160-like n=1 Tax=Lupinus angustifolius TaxID=3871 RepID=UPI00092F47C6|nr:PREDICTED: uncharacterized protein At1g08160-like [Lupinus angustifolius]